MNQTFVSLRFEQIEKRFYEIDILINLAINNQNSADVYQSLCRSIHVLLVSHLEGLYKEICKDILDDLNNRTNFFQVKKVIFNSHCSYFIQNNENEKAVMLIKEKLWNAFKEYPTALNIDSFIFTDNKNPTPKIIETILEKFGVRDFFWSIEGSDLDIVFEDQKTETKKLRNRLLNYIKKSTASYPYLVDKSFYNPVSKQNLKKGKTLWDDFINNFLNERHSIVHGHTLNSHNDHESLTKAKLKLEIILYVYIINICSAANPIILLPEKN